MNHWLLSRSNLLIRYNVCKDAKRRKAEQEAEREAARKKAEAKRRKQDEVALKTQTHGMASLSSQDLVVILKQAWNMHHRIY